jgi:hypothetical protein
VTLSESNSAWRNLSLQTRSHNWSMSDVTVDCQLGCHLTWCPLSLLVASTHFCSCCGLPPHANIGLKHTKGFRDLHHKHSLVVYQPLKMFYEQHGVSSTPEEWSLSSEMLCLLGLNLPKFSPVVLASSEMDCISNWSG